MHVISLVSQKGGAAKTTLAINLAAAAHRNNQRVLIVDLDPQRTAEAWYQDRNADVPQLVVATSTELPAIVTKARASGFDLVVIDTPGRDEPAVGAAIRAADFCVVPCRPSPADMKATPPTVATITRLGKPFAFVLTQTPPRGFRIREAASGLNILGPVAPQAIVARQVFQDAQGAGLGVIEFEADGKAAEEIRQLWSWIARKLKRGGDG